MTTMRDLCADTRRQVYGGLTDQMNVIAESAAANATELKMTLDITGITAGKVITSGLNVWYVTGSDAASKTVYVIPGYDNSRKDAVTANDFVYVNPRVTDWFLFNQINNEIRRLGSSDTGLYRVAAWTLPVDTVWQTYDIPVDIPAFLGMLRVRYGVVGSTDTWVDVPSRFVKQQFSDGVSRITLGVCPPASSNIEFTYKAPFTIAADLDADIVADCGIPESMLDIPVLGAAFRLIRTNESQRNQITSQGDSRRPNEVQSMSNLQTSNLMERDYEKRVREEANRLLRLFPYRQEW